MSRPVVVRFLGDMSNLTGTVGKVEGRFGGLKSTLLGLGIGTAILGEAKRATQGWQDHLVVQRDTENAIRATGGAAKVTAQDVGDLADAIERKTGKDGDAIQSGANMLLTFKGIRNEAGAGNDIFNQATSILTDMSAKMNGGKVSNEGMASSAVQLGKALNDPIKGISALSRVGVTFTDQQKAQIKAMVASGDTAGAQKIILKELASEFGGTARATSTSMDTMMVRVHALEDSLGQRLLPIVNAGAGIFASHSGAVLAAAGAAGALVLAVKIASAWEDILKVKTAAGAAIQGVARGATLAAAAAQRVLNLALAANPIGLVVTAIALIVGALVRWYMTSQRARDIINGAFRAITGAAQAALGWIRNHWPLILGILTGPVGAAVIAIVRNWDRIKALPGQAVELGRSLVRNFADGMRSLAGLILDAIRAIIPDPLERFLHLSSPAKEGPLSKDGGPERWGEKVAQFFTKGLQRGAGGLPGALGGLASIPFSAGALAAPGGAGGPSITVHANTNANPHEIGREVAWALRTSGR